MANTFTAWKERVASWKREHMASSVQGETSPSLDAMHRSDSISLPGAQRYPLSKVGLGRGKGVRVGLALLRVTGDAEEN